MPNPDPNALQDALQRLARPREIGKRPPGGYRQPLPKNVAAGPEQQPPQPQTAPQAGQPGPGGATGAAPAYGRPAARDAGDTAAQGAAGGAQQPPQPFGRGAADSPAKENPFSGLTGPQPTGYSPMNREGSGGQHIPLSPPANGPVALGPEGGHATGDVAVRAGGAPQTVMPVGGGFAGQWGSRPEQNTPNLGKADDSGRSL